MKCSPPLRYDQILFRGREIFEFIHMPDDQPEIMRILQDEWIEEKIKRGELQGYST